LNLRNKVDLNAEEIIYENESSESLSQIYEETKLKQEQLIAQLYDLEKECSRGFDRTELSKDPNKILDLSRFSKTWLSRAKKMSVKTNNLNRLNIDEKAKSLLKKIRNEIDRLKLCIFLNKQFNLKGREFFNFKLNTEVGSLTIKDYYMSETDKLLAK
jgi:hypothetical protein